MNLRLLPLIFSLILAVTMLEGQETRSTIHGRVLDPQSRAIAGAAVMVTNVETNTNTRLVTNETGYYEANLLLPGLYQVSAESPGFKRSVRGVITLPVSTRLEIAMQLELGAVAESVVVTAEAPILDTSTVSSGRIFDNRSMMNLPVLGNSAILFARQVPGVQTTGISNYVGLHSNGSGAYGINGKVGGQEFSLDGAPDFGNGRNIGYLPWSDTLQEFKVETSNFDASVGHSTGLFVAMVSKVGTNDFHGTLTEQHWQQRLNGTPFFVKQQYYNSIAAATASGDTALAQRLRSQNKQPSGHSNNFGATLGGPVIIPKVFNGKNRLFFFFSFNQTIDKKTDENNVFNHTVPTMANRQGDFSQLLNVDAVRYQIYDPLTIRPDPARPTHYIRDPFPRNMLPQARIINPLYSTYSKIMPPPNNESGNPRLEPVNNYLSTGSPFDWDYKAYTNRVDYRHSDRHRFFGRWHWSDWINWSFDWGWAWPAASGLQGDRSNQHDAAGAADWVWTISPATVLDVSASVNQYRKGEYHTAAFDYKPSDVGLPAYMDAKAGDNHSLPRITWSGYDLLGRNVYPLKYFMTRSAKAEISHVRGKHTLRGGFEWRGQSQSSRSPSNASGNFSFTNTYTRRNDDTNTPAGDFGHSWAAFMLGLPDTMTVDTNDSYFLTIPYYAWYVQNNYRVTPRLSLNLGLRLEYQLGSSERFNRAISYFDSSLKLPISDAAQAAYAKSPAPELSAAGFVVRGGPVYPGVNGVPSRLVNNEAGWLPRVAAAWQASSRTVLRIGYGMFYDSMVAGGSLDQTGFNRTTSTLTTTDYGMTWRVGDPRRGISPLTDPFPVRPDGTRFDAPVRNALGSMATVGSGWTFNSFNAKSARQQRWRVGVQQQLTANMVFEAAYAGSYTGRIAVAKTLSALPEQYWASGLVRNNAVATNMNANVANPFSLSNFAGMASSDPLIYQNMSTKAFFTGSTIRKNLLLRPYPQMNSLRQADAADGAVRTHAMELILERRFSRGFNLNASYTRLYSREKLTYIDEFDAGPSWLEGSFGRPHRFLASSVWELPFGKSRHFLSQPGVANALLGGWQIGVTYEYQPGPLLSWSNLFYYGDISNINTGPRTLDRWFNTADFERVSSKTPAAFHRRVFPNQVPGLRSDMTNNWNANVQREFKIKERLAFQLRVEALNLANRSQFDVPDTSPLSSNFGRVTKQTSAMNRFLQFQARLRF